MVHFATCVYNLWKFSLFSLLVLYFLSLINCITEKNDNLSSCLQQLQFLWNYWKNVISRFFECYFLMCDVGSEIISQEKGGGGEEKRIVIRILLRNQYYIKYINLWLDTKPLSWWLKIDWHFYNYLRHPWFDRSACTDNNNSYLR